MDYVSIVRKSKKIRIYPNSEQRQLFRQWFGTARFAYNKTVEYLKGDGTIANWKNIKTDRINELPDWSKNTPYQVRSIAIRDACRAVSNAKKKYMKNEGFNEISFRSRKGKQNIYVPKQAINSTKGAVFSRTIGKILMSEKLPEEIGDSRITFEHNTWWLIIPTQVETMISARTKQSVVSLDPGIRNFQSFYSEEYCGILGENAFETIFKEALLLDKMYSNLSKVGSKATQNIKKAISRKRNRIKWLIEELHWKVGNFLVQNFNTIIIPKFSAGDFVEKAKRKLNKKTVRNLLNLSHGMFLTRLIHLSKIHNVELYLVREDYTSKTCTKCGHIKYNLGSAKVFKCDSCGYIGSRDIVGARNILLRAMVDAPAIFIDKIA